MNNEQKGFIDKVNNAKDAEIFIKDTGREGIDLPPHKHRRTQVVLTLQGTLHVKVSEREYFVPEGHVCWIPSDMTHSLSSNNRRIALRIYYVSLQSTGKSPADEFAVFNLSQWASVNLSFMASHGSQISIENEGLHEFCMSFFQLFPDVEQKYVLPLRGIGIGTDKTLRDALDYIHFHLAENIRQEEVASAVGTSSRTLSRLFNEAGISFSGYLSYQRIITALELMADHAMTMREIAYATGFSAPANFNRTFKQVMGCSPSEMMRSTTFGNHITLQKFDN